MICSETNQCIIEYLQYTKQPRLRYLNCSNWPSVITIFILAQLFFIAATPTPTWVPTTTWITPTNCANWKFPCLNGQCISRRYVCDGINNCYDGSDEDYCNSTGWLFYSPLGFSTSVILYLFHQETSNKLALLNSFLQTFQSKSCVLTAFLRVLTVCCRYDCISILPKNRYQP